MADPGAGMVELSATAVRGRAAHGRRLAAAVCEPLAVSIHWLGPPANLRGRSTGICHADETAASATAGVPGGAQLAPGGNRRRRHRRIVGCRSTAVRDLDGVRLPAGDAGWWWRHGRAMVHSLRK